MDPITLAIIALIIGGTTAAVIVYIANLTMSILRTWFGEHKSRITYNKDLVAATINKGIQDGKYTIVQGVFNKRSKTMVESRAIETHHLDEELSRRHRRKDIVLYAAREY